MEMSEVEETTIDKLTLDDRNANEGTERGRYMLDYSLRQFGAGRSILVDKNGKILAGNKTIEAAADIGLDDVILVHSRGDKIVAVMRDDLDLDEDEEARLLAYVDNRAGEVGLAWSPEQVEIDLEQGLDLSGMFREDEVARIQGNLPEVDYDELWQGMPEFEQENQPSFQTIKVHFASRESRDEFADLIEQSITDKTISLWYPEKKADKLIDLAYQ